MFGERHFERAAEIELCVAMSLTDLRKTPSLWSGGKADAAPAVREVLGDVDHYVEPFAGSLAVPCAVPTKRTAPYHSETVNDLDGLFLQRMALDSGSPEATADAASWPV